MRALLGKVAGLNLLENASTIPLHHLRLNIGLIWFGMLLLNC